MKPLSVFRPRIAPRVDGCLDTIIDQSVLDACIEFCSRSLVVKRMLDPFQTVASRLAYDLTGASMQSVCGITRVWCDASELAPLDEDGLSGPYGFVTSVAGQSNTPGRPQAFQSADPGAITLYPLPDKAYTVNVRAALKPTRSATQVEDQLFEDWVEQIVDGSLARLYLHPGAWTNPGAAKYHLAKFEMGINTAMLEAAAGPARAQLRITPVHI